MSDDLPIQRPLLHDLPGRPDGVTLINAYDSCHRITTQKPVKKPEKILNRDRQVFLASTSAQAFEMVQRLGFSVVLVDVDMPGGGYALIQKLHDANPALLIIAIAGALKVSVLEATKEIGVVEVLKKPVTPRMEAGWRIMPILPP